MNGDEFIKKAKRYAKRNDLFFNVDKEHGKGSHRTLTVGVRMTTVKQSEIGKGLLAAMLKQLGIDKEDF